MLAADVVEEDVDAIRRGLGQLLGDRPVLVVERCVVAVLLDEQLGLLVGAALPIARAAPWSFAIWPTWLPTAPAAPETKTVSPSLIFANRVRPMDAVRPVTPSTPR